MINKDNCFSFQYKNPFPMRKSQQLVKRGEIEPYFDGLQSRKRYAKFWDGVEYDPEVIKFQSTQTSMYGTLHCGSS